MPQDYAEALRWYRKAAEQGDVEAQFKLGVMCMEGRGVPQNNVEAYLWLYLAASRPGCDRQELYADARDLAAKKMTPQQIAEAQRCAREWKPKSGEDKGRR